MKFLKVCESCQPAIEQWRTFKPLLSLVGIEPTTFGLEV